MIAPVGGTDFQTSITLVDPSLSASRTTPFPAGVLPPGASGTLTFSVLSTTKVTGAKITVGVTDFNSTETAPMDWKTLISGLEPSGFGTNTWQQIIYDIQGSLGTTEGSFADQVTSIVQTAAVYGITLGNESQIINYAVEEEIAEGYGANASGELSLQGTGKPLSQTGIELVSAGGSGVYSATSWYNGTFDVWGVPAGKYKLEVSGYLPRAETVKVTTLFTYTTPHTSNGLQVSVSTGATVTGKVTNATTSEPVTGAVVQVTDADGRSPASRPAQTASTRSPDRAGYRLGHRRGSRSRHVDTGDRHRLNCRPDHRQLHTGGRRDDHRTITLLAVELHRPAPRWPHPDKASASPGYAGTVSPQAHSPSAAFRPVPMQWWPRAPGYWSAIRATSWSLAPGPPVASR